jgi:protein-tyrosine phosphatase
MSSPSGGTETFSIVFLCTANRFRSPLAAAVLAQELPGVPVRIASRGTLDVGAMPPLAQALEAATQLGVDISRHRARLLGADELIDADLVIGFEGGHLEAARKAGAPADVVFGLEDAVELFERLDRSPALKNYAASLRHTVTAAKRLRDPQGSLAEIEDPVGKSPKEAAAIAGQIHSLTVRLARLLSP